MNGLLIATAYLLDLLFGDPQWLPHPVRLIGRFIQFFESAVRRIARSPRALKAAGIILVLLTVSLVYVLSQAILLLAFRISMYAGFVVSAVLASTTLATRGLADAARGVLRNLDAGDLVAARTELSLIVGRDTHSLDESGIVRAVVETVAENTSDGVIAPMFYLALGGPALALAYKAVNTLDSMVGYRNERYLHFGWAAARFDDIANFVPARITAVLLCLAADITRIFIPSSRPSPQRREGDSAISIPRATFRSPWRIMARDGRNHPSPNSGYPEAAVAGALGVRLGGPSTYGGRVSAKPFIGEPEAPLSKKHIEKSVQLLYSSSSAAVLASALILFFR